MLHIIGHGVVNPKDPGGDKKWATVVLCALEMRG